MADRLAGNVEGGDRQLAEFARQRCLHVQIDDRPRRRGAHTEFVLGIVEGRTLTAGAINLDLEERRCIPRLAECQDVLASAALDVAQDSVVDGAPAASGMSSAKAGKAFRSHPGRPIGRFDGIDRRARLKILRGAYGKHGNPTQICEMRTKVDGSSSRQECKAGCMAPSGSRCLGVRSRLEALPSGCAGSGPARMNFFGALTMGYKVAVVGATGNVGREMLNILAEREFPADEVVALASRKSHGHRRLLRRQDAEGEGARPLRFLRRRHLPDVGGRRGVEGMVAEDRRRRARW